jgi:hypothetical protein
MCKVQLIRQPISLTPPILRLRPARTCASKPDSRCLKRAGCYTMLYDLGIVLVEQQ